MISERKLRSLKPKTRIRKIGRLLYEIEKRLRDGKPVDVDFLSILLHVACEDLARPDIEPKTLESTEAAIREVNRIRHAILAYTGTDPADWDLFPRWSNVSADDTTANLNPPGSRRVFLEDIRSPFNVGAIFRTAAAYSVEEIILSPDCASPDHPRAIRTAMGAIESIRWSVASLISTSLGSTAAEEPIFALETGGADIAKFRFPERGTVVLGNEELGIAPDTRSAVCESYGVCTIPLGGPKASLNVSVAFGILMHLWCSSTRHRGQGFSL